MNWKFKLRNYEKFLQYHGCELVLLLPIPASTGENYHLSGYAKVNKNNTEFSTHGIVPIIFQITSKIFNFTDIYQPAATGSSDLTFIDKNSLQFVAINGKFWLPHVHFQMQPFLQNFESLRTTLPVTDTLMNIFMTPAEAYTPYEKLILPFDMETWILLILTFGVTVFVIFITNLFSKSTQQLVYGQKIDNPLWNVVSIFFGISQTRLPIETFPRLILTYFVIFCLIFRTCYQNKLFQYMTSEPRHAPPRTIEDLIDRNYTVYSSIKNLLLLSIEDGIGRRLNVSYIELRNYYDIFKTQSQNSTAKIALCVDEVFQYYLEYGSAQNHDWNKIDVELYTHHETFAFYQYSFYFRMFRKTIEKLIDTGVMKYLIQNHFLKILTVTKVQSGPNVLKVEDLQFGFNIWFGFCCISCVAFIAEFLWKLLSKALNPKCKKLKFAKVHPTSLDHCTDINTKTLKNFRVKPRINKVTAKQEA